MTSRGEKVRALFLAAIMVTSVVGMSVAFSGSAAAAVNSDTLDLGAGDNTAINVQSGTTLDSIQVDTDGNGASGDYVSVFVDVNDDGYYNSSEPLAVNASTNDGTSATDKDIETIDTSGLSEGSYSVYVVEQTAQLSDGDGDGTASNWDDSESLTIDDTAPSLSSVSPKDNNLTVNPEQTITVVLNDSVGMDTTNGGPTNITIVNERTGNDYVRGADDGTSGVTVDGTSPTATDATITVDPSTVGTDLSPGRHTITVNATDSAGNFQQFTSTLDVGKISQSTSNVNDAEATVNVSVYYPAGVDGNSLNLSVDNTAVSETTNLISEGTVVNGSTTSASNFTSGNALVYANVTLPLKEDTGGYDINVDAADANGNVNSTADTGVDLTGSFAVDMAEYQVGLFSDSDNPFTTTADTVGAASADETATLTVTAQDKFGHNLTAAPSTFGSGAVDIKAVTGTIVGQTGATGTGTQGSPITVDTASKDAGDHTLRVLDTNNNLLSGETTQTFNPDVGGAEVTANTTSILGDQSEAAKVTLQLTDGNGNDVTTSGINVIWNADSEANQLGETTTTTNNNGEAYYVFDSSTAGTDIKVIGQEQRSGNQANATVSTTSGSVAAGTSDFQLAGDASDKSGIKVNTDHTAYVSLRDGSSNPVSGQDVTLERNGTQVATLTTNSTGEATTTVTLPTTKGTSQYNVTGVQAFNASATSDAIINVTTKAENASTLALNPNGASVASESTKELTVEIQDQYGNQNMSYDQTITVASGDVNTIDFGAGTSSTSAKPSDSGSAGEINVTLQANATSGSTDITASTMDNVTNKTAQFSIGSAQSIAVSYDNRISTSSNAQQTTTLYAQLLDGSGNAIGIENENVSFAQSSGSAAKLDERQAPDYVANTNSTGVATIQINATSSTGSTTFLAQAENFSATGSAPVTTTGAAEKITVSPASSSTAVNESVNVTVAFTDSQDREVPRTDSISVSTDLGSVTTTPVKPTVTADGASATTALNSSQSGTANLTAIGGGKTGSATITVEAAAQPSQPTASVTFDDQTVTNGAEEVTVANANYTLADGTAGDYVVVAHVVNDDGSISNPVGYSSNVSGDTDGITVDLNASEAQGDDLDTLTANTTLRAMLHETSSSSAYGPSLGLATDDADITVEEDAPAYYTLTLSNSIADRAVQTTTISTFSTHRQSGSTALLPRSVYRYTRTHTGGL